MTSKSNILRPSLLKTTGICTIFLIGLLALFIALMRPLNGYARSAEGLTAYLDMKPAITLKGRQTMHGGASTGPHEYHLGATIFGAADAVRVSDAKITAKIIGSGFAPQEATLEPMGIGAASNYGGFIYLPGADIYTIELVIQRAGSQRPVVLDFSYDHRRQ